MSFGPASRVGLRVIVCVQVRGQIECRLTGVSNCFACDCVCVVSAGQRSDRVSFDRCLELLRVIVCVCVSAGQRSDRVSFNRVSSSCLRVIGVCRSEVRLSVV